MNRTILTMAGLLSASSLLLVDSAVKVTALLMLAAAAAIMLRRDSAATRHLVWMLAMVAMLAVPVLSAMLPQLRVLPEWASISPATTVVPTNRPSIPPPTVGAIEVEKVAPNNIETPSASASQLSAARADSWSNLVTPKAIPTSTMWSWNWRTALPLVWATGFCVLIVRLMAARWILWKVERQGTVIGSVGVGHASQHARVGKAMAGRLETYPTGHDTIVTAIEAALIQVGLRRKVTLLIHPDNTIPMVWGILRSRVLLPAAAQHWSGEQLRSVLLHELAHIKRRDMIAQLVVHLACALYWFNPLVWFAAWRIGVERERACDDLVLASGVRPSAYARHLLEIVTGLAPARWTQSCGLTMARKSSLEGRLVAVLSEKLNRRGITTAVAVAALLLGVGIAVPLAMLRAAEPDKPKVEATAVNANPEAPKPTELAVGDERVDRDPTPKEIEAPTSGIRIRVLNATGDRGIPEFRVIAGVSSESVAEDFEKRTGRAVIDWQPHTCRIGKDGDLVWPLASAYDEMALRVEADGYQPQVVTGIKKADGPKQIVFQLAEDKGLPGRVLSPAGEPAAGATVAMALAQKNIVWDGSKLRGADDPLPEKPGDRWRRPLVIKADADGSFRLPTEIEPAALLVIHESGVLELAYDAWRKSPELTLQRWGRIEGQVLWHDQPGADEDLTLSIHRDEYGYPGMITSYRRTRTDKDGKFIFDRVLPGLVQISRPIKPASASDIREVNLNSMSQHVKVAAGDVTKMLFGGQGRNVTGKFVGLDSWEGATFQFHPDAPHIGFPGDDALRKAFGQLKQSPIGPLFFRDKQPINRDGTFTIENMLPGRYQLFLSAPGFSNYAAITQFQVEPEVPDQEPVPLDLGEIAPMKKPADSSAEKPIEPRSAKTVSIRGKVVDDATGEPIGRLIVQGGKFEPADPTKVSWGYSEGRSSSPDGSFSTSVRWADGWTVRILADGYIPQPVIEAAPPADKDELEVTIRLRRGPTVRGVVLDHAGEPVTDAAVLAIGPTGLNVAAGQAWSSSGAHDDAAQPVRTDEQGRFELPTGEAKSLAVSHPEFDAWPAAIPASGEVTVRLPEPARVEIDLDIDGADKENVIFYQLLSHHMPGFAGLQSSREMKIANPGKLVLDGLTPGKYQLCRNVMHQLSEIGTGAMLDRQFFELKAGESKSIDFVREIGARVRGKVSWPADTKLMGTVISVQNLVAQKGPFDNHEWTTTYASQTAAAGGTFLTERIAPGKYLLVAEAYTPMTPEQRFRTGEIVPSHRAQVTIDVPVDGELTVNDLALKPIASSK